MNTSSSFSNHSYISVNADLKSSDLLKLRTPEEGANLKQDDCPAKQVLLSVLGKEDASAEEVSAGIDALQQLGSIEYGMSRAEEYHAQAHQLLDRIPPNPALMALRELTDLQLKRLN